MCSIVAVHNETGNIWTHLLGFIVFAVLGYIELATQWGDLRTLPLLDRVVFGIFFIAACKCLACSTIWHTFAQIAHLETMKSMACVDYVGISVLICASVMVFEYYGFYASSWPQAIYLTSTGILAIAGIFVPFSSWFDKREYRFLRTVFFLALGTSAVVPIVHLVFLHGLNTVLLWLSPLLSSIACYLTGVFLYVNHYPEKIFPGWFDHIGNSHQLWHMCVVAGIWFHYRAGIRFVASPGVIGLPCLIGL
jgi:adiponectin receptor